MIDLRRFQKPFMRAATSPEYTSANLSLARGNGKSTLAAHLLTRVLTPSDPLFRAGSESILLSGSIEQCRIVFRMVRQNLGDSPDYTYLDSGTRAGITHRGTKTRLKIHGSNAKTAFGLVGVQYVVWDEPGASEVNAGQMLQDAIETAQGKPDSPLKIIRIGTLAPATGGFWHDIINRGSYGRTYVQVLQGQRKTWDSWHTIRKANPLTAVSADFRKTLLEERDEARKDSRLKARFLSYRLNLPTADEATMLLTLPDWERVERRPLAERQGKPIISVDLGAGRAWSAAVATWKTGRVEALALAPGIPSIEAQEKRDRVPAGSYRKLVETGRLMIAHGLRVQTAKQLMDAAFAMWGKPAHVIADRFQIKTLADATNGVKLIDRVTRWSEASEDIRATRKMALDGPMTVEPESRPLLAASLAHALVNTSSL